MYKEWERDRKIEHRIMNRGFEALHSLNVGVGNLCEMWRSKQKNTPFIYDGINFPLIFTIL